MPHFLDKLEQLGREGKIPAKLIAILSKFYESYASAVAKNALVTPSAMADVDEYDGNLNIFLDMVVEQLKHPFPFDLYHEKIVSPFNYYQFGLDFIRPLILFERSKVLGLDHLDTIQGYLSKGENVIFLANHQTEPDPQAISLLLEKTYPRIAEEMIFVAGHRVITDPLAAPFSMGRNLLCIFSKKYIETPPEQKEEKLLHNQRTMNKMSQLLSEGGKCIYVAPSGGRDRPNFKGVIEIAKFDPQSVEMLRLMAQKAGRITHFYPLSLSTYMLFPPPNSIEIELGEKREAHCTPISLAVGREIDMEKFPGSEVSDKRLKRGNRAEYIWSEVKKGYDALS